MPLVINDAKPLKDFLRNEISPNNKTQHDCAGSYSRETPSRKERPRGLEGYGEMALG
jgi:hypothetical protein